MRTYGNIQDLRTKKPPEGGYKGVTNEKIPKRLAYVA